MPVVLPTSAARTHVLECSNDGFGRVSPVADSRMNRPLPCNPAYGKRSRALVGNNATAATRKGTGSGTDHFHLVHLRFAPMMTARAAEGWVRRHRWRRRWSEHGTTSGGHADTPDLPLNSGRLCSSPSQPLGATSGRPGRLKFRVSIPGAQWETARSAIVGSHPDQMPR